MTQPPGEPEHQADDLLGTVEHRRDAARAAVVSDACQYLEHATQLPATARRDTSTRHAIAMRVLHRLTDDDHTIVHEWRRRWQDQCDHCRWSSLIHMLTVQEALAYLEGHGLDRDAMRGRSTHHRQPQ